MRRQVVKWKKKEREERNDLERDRKERVERRDSI